MTQPPDERDPLAGDPRPPSETPRGEPPTDTTGESPTQAWTPTPTPAPQPSASPLISAEPAVPAETPQGPEPARPFPDATPATPATPAAPVSGWVQPGPPTPAPLVAWEAPQAPVEVAGQEGYVIAGVGARIVAYLIDAVLVSIIPTLLSLLITD